MLRLKRVRRSGLQSLHCFCDLFSGTNLSLFFTDMLSFQRQLSRPPPRKSRAVLSRPLAPATSPTPRLQQVQVSVAGPSNRPEKRRRASEIDLADPSAVDPESVMAATKGVAREALAEQVRLLRRTEIMAS